MVSSDKESRLSEWVRLVWGRFIEWWTDIGKKKRGRVSLVVIIFLASGVVMLVRETCVFQPPEFHTYDQFIKWQRGVDTWLNRAGSKTNTDIVIIEIVENDIKKFDYPLFDRQFAELIELLQSYDPAVIGLDIYRDLPVPRHGNDLPTLNALLGSPKSSNIVVAWKYAVTNKNAQGIPPPPVLRESPGRLGFANFMTDDEIDGEVRRGLLYSPDDDETVTSLALQIARIYLLGRMGEDRLPIEPRADAADADVLRLGKTTFLPLDKNFGGYLGTDDGGYQILLDFRGPPDFQRFSYGDLLNNKISRGKLEGKIVLVGCTAESVADYLTTPLQHYQRGIELQAHFIEQLVRAALDGAPPKRSLNEWQEIAWVVIWCMVGGLVSFHINSPGRFFPLIIVALPVQMGLTFLLFLGGWWVPWAMPTLGFFLSSSLVTANRFYRERRERSVMEQAFKGLVSEEVVDEVQRNPEDFVDPKTGRLTSRETIATIMFTDLKGSVGLAEKMKSPSLFVDFLNEYMEVMTDLVIKEQGMVSRFFGDAILGVFGTPKLRTTKEEMNLDAVNAVRCAILMEQELAKLNVKWLGEELQPVQMRVGIYTGQLVAGAIGSRKRMEYTVIGDSVNIAARLEGLDKEQDDPEFTARHSRILIGDTTYERLGDKFNVKPLGTINLRGKTESVTVYRVIGLRRKTP